MECRTCFEYEGNTMFGHCSYYKGTVPGGSLCPYYHDDDIHVQKVEEEVKEEVQETPAHPQVSKVVDTKRRPRSRKTAYPIMSRFDGSRPVIELFAHQKAAFERHKDSDVIPLFFEMGCGKTITTLRIAEYKYKKGEIKGLIVIAPNDVHKQWYDDLVYGVDINHDGVMWQEISCDVAAQCVGGRGGQKEVYEFGDADAFRFLSVNVDTFSTPSKWKDIVDIINMDDYMLAIDEATVIKNPDSNRSQRLLYEFNNVVKHRKSIVSSVKKDTSRVRAVLTGTPTTNGPVDLWAIMEFVSPNFFNRNYWSFKNYYGMFTKLSVDYITPSGQKATREVNVLINDKTWTGIHACQDYSEAFILFGCSEDTYMTIKHQDHFIGPYKHADELREKLSEVATFAKLTDCVDMPPVKYITRRMGMSVEQQKIYNSMRKDLIAKYDGYETTAKNKLIVNLRLQQISSGFIMAHKSADTLLEEFFEGNVDNEQLDLNPDDVMWINETNPKLDALMQDVAETDKPLLILTRYSAEAAKIYDLCEKAGYRTGLFTGWKVVGGVDAFKAGELDILVANSNKVARGFNLQIAHTTLFYSNTFSMETRQQAEFRTFRIGQKHTCLYIDYACAEVDDTVTTALTMKKNLLEYIRAKDLKETV